jgi:hypothetical protein
VASHQLTTVDALPPGFLDCDARDLVNLLPGPTLIHLPGRDERALFASVLVHGNEVTGFDAVRHVLRRNGQRTLPRALSLFVGNVAAAAASVRTLPEQNDYNRVWPGTVLTDAPEARLMAEVVDAMRERQPFASIDIHNNTGLNPHYACVSRLEPPYLHLARLFSRLVVYFRRPVGVQSIAMSAICPAVTVECGHSGTHDGISHAAEFIEACLHLSEFPEQSPARHDIELLETVAIVRVPSHLSMSFDGSNADIRFREDLDHLNFSAVPAGTVFGHVASPGVRLEILPGHDRGALCEWFDYREGDIRLTRAALPAMLTRDTAAIRHDCLCYLMERIPI